MKYASDLQKGDFVEVRCVEMRPGKQQTIHEWWRPARFESYVEERGISVLYPNGKTQVIHHGGWRKA